MKWMEVEGIGTMDMKHICYPEGVKNPRFPGDRTVRPRTGTIYKFTKNI